MNRGPTKTLSTEDNLVTTQKSSPGLPALALRFVALLAAIVIVLTWAWSR